MLVGHAAIGPAVLAGFDGVASDLGAVGDPASIPFEQEFSDSLSSTISQGQTDFDAFAVHLTGNNPPASGGGGGGTGGGTGGGGAVTRCDYTLYFGVDDQLPTKQSVTFKNLLNVPMHIKSKTLTQNVDGTFSETDNIPATMQPGATFDIDVTYTTKAVIGTHGTFVIETDAPTSPHTLCMQLAQSDQQVGSGSGGAGGIDRGRKK